MSSFFSDNSLKLIGLTDPSGQYTDRELAGFDIANIRKLNLSGNQITAEGVRTLVSKIEKNGLDYFHLVLNDNPIGKEGISSLIPLANKIHLIIEARGTGVSPKVLDDFKSKIKSPSSLYY